MIRGRKFIVYTTAANALSKGYWSVLIPSIQSVIKHDFVDEFVILTGGSEDGTVESLHELSTKNHKIIPMSSPKWSSSSWTWKILLEQYNHFLDATTTYATDNSEEIIVLYQGSDQVWCDDYAKELLETLNRMVDADFDYFLTPFRKTVNINHLTPIYPYHPTGFSVYSAMRLRPNHRYIIGGNEDILETSHAVQRLKHNFKNSSISYDMAFFTREQILNKIRNHNCGISQREVDEYIRNGFLKKCLSMSLTKIKMSDHPIEMHDMIKNLDDNLFGKTCFEHFRE